MDPNNSQPIPRQPQPEAPASDWQQPATPTEAPSASPQPFTALAPESTAQPATPQPTPTPLPQPEAATATPAPASASKGLAIAAMVVGIIAFVTGPLGLLLGLVAIVLGVVSLVKKRGGKGFSITGIVLGALAMIGGAIFLLIGIIAFNGINDRGAATMNYNHASEISKVASKYSADHVTADDSFAYHYPTYDQLVAEPAMSELKKDLHAGNASSVTKDKPIAYESCSEGGTLYYYAGVRGVESFPTGFPEKC